MSIRWGTKELVGGLLSILSFIACLVFAAGPDLIRVPALITGVVFGIASWILGRKSKGTTNSANTGAMDVLADEEEFLVVAIREKLDSDAIALELDPVSFLPESAEKRVVHVRVLVDGIPLSRTIVIPMPSGILDTDSEDTRRFMIKEQVARLSKDS